MDSLLQVSDLTVRYRLGRGSFFRAVHKVGFRIEPNRILAVVGESGSGKSTLGRSLTGLAGDPTMVEQSGKMRYQRKAYAMDQIASLRSLRGREIAYVFQEPSAAMNPVWSIGRQIAEAVTLHQGASHNRKETVIRLLAEVKLPDPEGVADAYPHELSGGMLQRAVIAMALACQPRILIADEPTTALDVTTQQQILELIRSQIVGKDRGALLITHHLGLVDRYADDVIVLRQGRLLESGRKEQVLSHPQTTYTRQLIQCLPRLGDTRRPLPVVSDESAA